MTPAVFVVPTYMGLPAWIDQLRVEKSALLSHPLGISRLTEVTIETGSPPATAVEIQLPGLHFRPSELPMMELVFDDGRQGATLDLRPGLPLVMKY